MFVGPHFSLTALGSYELIGGEKKCPFFHSTYIFLSLILSHLSSLSLSHYIGKPVTVRKEEREGYKKYIDSEVIKNE
jgi:hypothetical protein